MPDSSASHQREAADRARLQPVRCAILTVSDTRTMENDKGGALIERFVKDAGHEVAARRIVRDEPDDIRRQIEQWLRETAIHAVLTTGGTGIARRDTTIEVVRSLLTVELEGFGELFRMLSFAQVQGAAMLSRTVGGLVLREPSDGGDTFIFAMPGSPNAVETAMANLIAPQLAHLVWERKK
jgi:molybdopterin adenylyltransferase